MIRALNHPATKTTFIAYNRFLMRKKLNFFNEFSIRVDVVQPFRKGQKIHCLVKLIFDFFLDICFVGWYFEFKNQGIYTPRICCTQCHKKWIKYVIFISTWIYWFFHLWKQKFSKIKQSLLRNILPLLGWLVVKRVRDKKNL